MAHVRCERRENERLMRRAISDGKKSGTNLVPLILSAAVVASPSR
jgi:hypothetical protein